MLDSPFFEPFVAIYTWLIGVLQDEKKRPFVVVPVLIAIMAYLVYLIWFSKDDELTRIEGKLVCIQNGEVSPITKSLKVRLFDNEKKVVLSDYQDVHQGVLSILARIDFKEIRAVKLQVELNNGLESFNSDLFSVSNEMVKNGTIELLETVLLSNDQLCAPGNSDTESKKVDREDDSEDSNSNEEEVVENKPKKPKPTPPPYSIPEPTRKAIETETESELDIILDLKEIETIITLDTTGIDAIYAEDVISILKSLEADFRTKYEIKFDEINSEEDLASFQIWLETELNLMRQKKNEILENEF